MRNSFAKNAKIAAGNWNRAFDASSGLSKIVVLTNDQDKQLMGFLAYIRDLAGPGHSFSVVVDPDTKENTKKFFFDGDGAFRIKEIKTEADSGE